MPAKNPQEYMRKWREAHPNYSRDYYRQRRRKTTKLRRYRYHVRRPSL